MLGRFRKARHPRTAGRYGKAAFFGKVERLCQIVHFCTAKLSRGAFLDILE